MNDIYNSGPYKRLIKTLNGTRNNLWDACKELNIDFDDIDDDILDSFIINCSHCDIWGTTHRLDEDSFPVCTLCLRLVGS